MELTTKLTKRCRVEGPTIALRVKLHYGVKHGPIEKITVYKKSGPVVMKAVMSYDSEPPVTFYQHNEDTLQICEEGFKESGTITGKWMNSNVDEEILITAPKEEND